MLYIPSIHHPEHRNDSEPLASKIIGENIDQYLVEWEADEETGEKVQPRWVPKLNVDSEMVEVWESEKTDDHRAAIAHSYPKFQGSSHASSSSSSTLVPPQAGSASSSTQSAQRLQLAPQKLRDLISHMKIAPLSRLNANGFPTRAWLLETFPSHFQKRTRFLKLDSVLRQYSPAQLEVSADFWNWITGATPGTPLRFRISSKAAPTSALTFGSGSGSGAGSGTAPASTPAPDPAFTARTSASASARSSAPVSARVASAASARAPSAAAPAPAAASEPNSETECEPDHATAAVETLVVALANASARGRPRASARVRAPSAPAPAPVPQVQAAEEGGDDEEAEGGDDEDLGGGRSDVVQAEQHWDLMRDEQQRQQQQQSPPQRHCNEQLHPTTSTHTGPIYPCAHHAYHHGYNFNVCTGCREAYFWQGRFSPAATAIVRNGARVPVCTPCAYAYEEMFPPGYNGCRCDMAWLCFRCRVVELEGLVKAKRGYNKGEVDEGMCPCAEGRFADQFCGVEFCLRCERPALKERVFVGGHT